MNKNTIKSSVNKHTVNWLKKMSKRNALDFTISIQRKEVWDLEHKSNLIGAILLGVPIESLLFEEDNNEGFLVLDGKQRSTSILQFLNDEYAISNKCKIREINGQSIVGLKFSELPEDFQEDILETELSVSTVRPLTDEDRELLFFMRNQAIALTNIELTRVLLGGSAMKDVEDLSSHNFISKTAVGSTSHKNKCTDQQVVLECIQLDDGLEFGFDSKSIKEYAEIVNEKGISKEQKDNVLKVFNYLDKAIEEKSKHLKKVHIPMIYSVAKKAIELEVEGRVFEYWMNEFFNYLKENPDNEYNQAVANSSAKLTQVKKRIKFMNEHFDENLQTCIGAGELLNIMAG